MNLFETREKLYEFDAQVAAESEAIVKYAADVACDVTKLHEMETHRDSVVKRRDVLSAEVQRLEAAQRDKVAQQHPTGDADKDAALKHKAAYYRAVASGDKAAIAKSYQGLGAIPAANGDMGSGSNLLPTNLSADIIAEPYEENSLRRVEQTSQIKGLEEPRVAFAIDDDDLLEDVVDFETAKEIQTSADMVTYGRHKTRLLIKVSDTVVNGTDTGIVSTVEGELRSALARKEKLAAFAKSADDDHKHMSYYMVGIKGVTGATVVAAIMAALGDLPDAFRANAKVIMRSADWYTYIQTLANSSDTLFGKKPEDVLGVPVIFNDRATIPVIGDFRYARQNYDPDAILDADKDITNGTYRYVLTAWGDHQIKLKSAFRLAIVAIAVIGGVAKSATAARLAGEAVTATPVFNTDASNTPTSGITYLWQSLQSGVWTDLTSAYSGYNAATLTTVDSQDEGVSFRCKITYSSASVYTNEVTMA